MDEVIRSIESQICSIKTAIAHIEQQLDQIKYKHERQKGQAGKNPSGV